MEGMESEEQRLLQCADSALGSDLLKEHVHDLVRA